MKTAGAGWIRLIEPVKRETGASPVRTRHCEQGISEKKKVTGEREDKILMYGSVSQETCL